MGTTKTAAITMSLSCLFLTAHLSFAARQPQKQTHGETAKSGTTWFIVGSEFATLLNSAEANYKQAHGRYADDKDLKKSGAVQNAMMTLMKDIGFDSLKNYRWNFHIDTSASGQAYQLSVYNLSPAKCQVTFFSSDNGVVFAGKEVSCQPNQEAVLKKMKGLGIEGHQSLRNSSGLIGNPAPGFTLRDLDGKAVSLGDYKGKAVVIDFWATWCTPCVAEMAWLTQMKTMYGSQGLVVLGIDEESSAGAVLGIDEARPASKESIQTFSREHHLNYPVLLDDGAVAKRYHCCNELPLTYYVGRKGKVLAVMYGVTSRDNLESDVKTALATKAAVAQ